MQLDLSMIYSSQLLASILDAGKKTSGAHRVREALILRMLEQCTRDATFRNATELSKRLAFPIAQAVAVWDVCIARNVLRPKYDGFSAIDWMQEHGIIPRRQIAQNQESPPMAGTCPPAPKKSKIGQNGAVKSASASAPYQPGPGDRPDIIRPRYNVTIRTQELTDLKGKYDDKMLEAIYDKLSAYKAKSGKEYQSDYAAIVSWVGKAVQKEKDEEIVVPGEHLDDEFFELVANGWKHPEKKEEKK